MPDFSMDDMGSIGGGSRKSYMRAEEIRNLYFQQRTEVVDDASWVMGFLDVIDSALDSIKRLLNLDQDLHNKAQEPLNEAGANENGAQEPFVSPSSGQKLDPFKLDILMENSGNVAPKRIKSARRMWRRSWKRTTMTLPRPSI